MADQIVRSLANARDFGIGLPLCSRPIIASTFVTAIVRVLFLVERRRPRLQFLFLNQDIPRPVR